MNCDTLIDIVNVNVALGGKSILRDISWKLQRGENWLVNGPNGSGKSTFLNLIKGSIWPAPDGVGLRTYHIEGETSESPVGLEGKITLVSPEQQMRYERSDWNLTAEEVVLTGFEDADLLYQRPSRIQMQRTAELFIEYGLNGLRKVPFTELSQGELRKILILRALVTSPVVVLLDEMGGGLDLVSCGQVLVMIGKVVRSGSQVIMTAHRAEEMIPVVTRVAELKEGRLVRQAAIERNLPGTRPVAPRSLPLLSKIRKGFGDKPVPIGVSMKNADVFRDDRRVLKEIEWEIGPGENWSISGPNGSGKSTLLGLVYGDFTPALGGVVDRFDEQGILSVQEARNRMGLVSAKLQAAHDFPVSVSEVVASGFFSSIGLIEIPDFDQWNRVQSVLEMMGLTAFAQHSITELSYGEARLVMIGRAVVHSPSLLLLDEPLEGLDAQIRETLRNCLDEFVQRGIQLVMVSHHPDDIPESITHLLTLEEGMIVP